MSVSQSIQSAIEKMPLGQVFGYQSLPGYNTSPSAVVKTMSRLVADQKLKRLSKGQFYVPKQGLLGAVKPSDSEIIRAHLYKNGRLRGYITGLALFNQLGLTTQMPSTITLAVNGGNQFKDLGTIKVRTIISRVPIKEAEVPLLQYLDVLRDIKKIPDADINQSLRIMTQMIGEFASGEIKRLIQLANDYYSPQTKALLCLLLSNTDREVPKSLQGSLNPTTTYKLGLDKALWPNCKMWNIR